MAATSLATRSPASADEAPLSTEAGSRRGSYVAGLDGLRALAVLAVMGVHAGLPGARLGWLGVDVFFVLSGFLITTLLLKEYRQTGAIDLPRFWARRALRLMPAYWLYIGAVTFAMLLSPGTLHDHAGWTPGLYVASLWGYFVNYAPSGGIWDHQFLTVHLWSLAIEEQFYFFWALCCALGFRSRRFVLFALALTAGVFAYRVMAPEVQAHALYTRGLGVLAGCLTALLCRGGVTSRARARVFSVTSRCGMLALILLLYAAATALVEGEILDEVGVRQWVLPPFVALVALLVAGLWYGLPGTVDKVLAWGPLVYVGRISYGVYLYHLASQVLVWQVLLRGIDDWPRGPKFGLRLCAHLALTLLIASASYRWWERPFLALKDRLH